MSLLNDISTGTDLEKVKRFKNLDESFLNKIYTPQEVEYCFKKKRPEESLAARFCAKEAIVKAFNGLNLRTPALKDIEILVQENGVPYVKVNNYESTHVNVKITMSHNEDYAVAFAIVERINDF